MKRIIYAKESEIRVENILHHNGVLSGKKVQLHLEVSRAKTFWSDFKCVFLLSMSFSSYSHYYRLLF